MRRSKRASGRASIYEPDDRGAVPQVSAYQCDDEDAIPIALDDLDLVVAPSGCDDKIGMIVIVMLAGQALPPVLAIKGEHQHHIIDGTHRGWASRVCGFNFLPTKFQV